MMKTLRDEIVKLRNKHQNANGKHFVPHPALHDLMSTAVVRDALQGSKIERYLIDQTTAAVINGAIKIFAILTLIHRVELILKFIQGDGFSGSRLDHKLPFELDKLRAILSDSTASIEFYEHQWEFTAPVFNGSLLPRVLQKEVIMPYLKEDHIGQGGFGDVYEVEIESSHQVFNGDQFHGLVRKEFKPSRISKDDDDETKFRYQAELRNLSMLSLLKHPNLVELLGSYTHGQRHNLLFPLARGGTLADLFKSRRPPELQSDTNLILALCGLGSAICAVHEFACQHLQAIGCHHDLKPSNVLVDSSSFILADFGLARLKELPETSETIFRLGRGDYLAPECDDIDADFQRGVIHRSSDIWSFGCIIAELLTYRVHGPDGVERFKRERRFRKYNFYLCRFACGSAVPNEAVNKWLEDLDMTCPTSARLLPPLVRRMLSLTPEDRPKASEVEAALRFTALDALTQLIDKNYKSICAKSNSIQSFVEQKRFASWKGACQIEEVVASRGQGLAGLWAGKSYTEFQEIVSRLADLEKELKAIEPDCENPRDPVFVPLRWHNDHLLSMLPRELQDQAMKQLEREMLQIEDASRLDEIRSELQDQASSMNCQAGVLAAIKRIRILVDEPHSRLITPRCPTNLQIDPRTLDGKKEQLESFYVTRMARSKEGGCEEKDLVLVEQRPYSIQHADHEELLARLDDIATLLNSADKPDGLRVLPCRGFFHDTRQYTFGLVYDFPHGCSRATTLQSILPSSENKRQQDTMRPLLGDRFQLAHDLALSLLKFHTVGWLHRSISSSNIAFFLQEGCPMERRLHEWSFLGFLHSRIDDWSVFTEGPSDDTQHRGYQHPEYVQNRSRFRPEFDYYSLGIVLLEIGLWESLNSLARRMGGLGLEDFRRALIKRRVLELGHYLGAAYRDAVKACLTSEFGHSSESESESSSSTSSANLLFAFETCVVDRLAQCKA